jgi:hypothetical protein
MEKKTNAYRILVKRVHLKHLKIAVKLILSWMSGTWLVRIAGGLHLIAE